MRLRPDPADRSPALCGDADSFAPALHELYEPAAGGLTPPQKALEPRRRGPLCIPPGAQPTDAPCRPSCPPHRPSPSGSIRRTRWTIAASWYVPRPGETRRGAARPAVRADPWDGTQGLFFTLTLLALGATAGRFVVRRRQAIGAASPSPTKTSARAPAAAWADGLNGAAALVLVAYVCVWFVPWPVYGDTSPSSFVYTFWLLSWLLLYLVKFSLLLLYRALFAVSATFRAAWWGVAAFTAIVFLGGFVALFWICGRPGAFLDEGAPFPASRRGAHAAR